MGSEPLEYMRLTRERPKASVGSTSGATSTPNLFLVGAPRCGTTALYTHLRAHPSVFMSPVKEPYHFSTDLYVPPPQVATTTEEEYLAMFGGASGERWLGEASPFYLYSAVAPEAIKAFSRDARVVITVRNPVDMMYSMYCLRVQAALFHPFQETSPSFEEALDAGPARLRGEDLPAGALVEPRRCLYLCYQELGRYADHVERFLSVFDRRAVHVVVFDDLASDTDAVLANLARFLEIDPAVAPVATLSRARRAGGVRSRSRRLARLLWSPHPGFVHAARAIIPQRARRSLREALGAWNDRPPPELDPRTRRRVLDECAPDVRRLGEVIERDLSHWLR